MFVPAGTPGRAFRFANRKESGISCRRKSCAATGTPVGKVRGADVESWRVVVPAAGLGYFLVGDAAAVLDPASSHGVLKAIMSGMMAAHLVTQVVHHDASESLAVQMYSDWIRRWFDHDVAGLRALYARLPGSPR